MKKYKISEKRALATGSGAKPAGTVVTKEQLNNWGLSDEQIEDYVKGGRLSECEHNLVPIDPTEPEEEPEEEPEGTDFDEVKQTKYWLGKD